MDRIFEGHCISGAKAQRNLDPFDDLPSLPPPRKRNQPAKPTRSKKQTTRLKGSSIKPETSKGTETYAANLDGAKAQLERAFGNCESDFTSPLDKAMFGNPGFEKPKTSRKSARNRSDSSLQPSGPRVEIDRNARVQDLVDLFRASQQRSGGFGNAPQL